MAFPDDPLNVEVSIALGADLADPGSWSWTNISTYVDAVKYPIRIRRGRTSERGTIPPARCTLTVDNTDGRFCRLNPTGAWYGQINKNTPIRVRVNNGSGYVTRFVGYVSGWPPTWDPTGHEHTVTVTADGILRRLGQGRVLRSPLYRTMTGSSVLPFAYWPMEDGSDAITFAAATAGTPAASGGLYDGSTDPVQFAGSSEIPGAATAAQLPAGAIVNFTIPSHTSSGTWATQVALHEDETGTQFSFNIRSVPDNVSLTVLVYPGTPLFLVGAVNITTGATIFSNTDTITATEVVGVPASLIVGCSAAAGGTTVVRLLDGSGNTIASTTNTGTGVSMTPRTLSAQCVPVGGGGSMAIASVAYFNSASFNIASDGVEGARAAGAWVGEMAHERVERLAGEEGIPVTVTATTSQAMGPQGVGTVVDEWRSCATRDFGLLYEPFGAGVAYLSSSERYNPTATITLDYDQGHIVPPWDPVDDDRDFRNDVTATRRGGSSARVTDEDSIDAVGVYDDTISANTETDEQLPDVAGWAVNLGTVDELRWPSVKLDLRSNPSLIDDWLATDLGDELDVINHPSPLAPDTIQQLVEGYEETIGIYQYDVTVNLSPASGWTVAELDDDNLGKLDTDGSRLITAYNSSATSLVVASTVAGSPLWTTDSGEMPIPLIVAGEVMSATAISSVAFDNFGRNTSNGWGTSDSGHAWGRGGGADADFSVTTAGSGTGNINMPTSMTERWMTVNVSTARHGAQAILTTNTLPVGGVLRYGLGVRYVDTSNYIYGIAEIATTGYITAFIRKRVAGVISDVASTTTALTIANNVLCRLRADDTTVTLWLWYQTDPFPMFPTISGTVADAVLQTGTRVGVFCRREGSAPTTVEYDGFEAVNPQTFTVVRSVNGVSKTQAASTDVNVYRPARLAL